MLNADLKMQDIYRHPVNPKTGFKKFKVVTIPRHTLLCRLDEGDAPEDPRFGVISGWWSPVKPFFDDIEGVVGKYRRAVDSGQTLRDYVRDSSAIKMEWNALSNYVQVKLKQDTKAWWGTFKEMPLWDTAEWVSVDYGWMADLKPLEKMQLARNEGNSGAMPEVLGLGESWQFYIPNLTDTHIERKPEWVVSSIDMPKLSQLLMNQV